MSGSEGTGRAAVLATVARGLGRGIHVVLSTLAMASSLGAQRPAPPLESQLPPTDYRP